MNERWSPLGRTALLLPLLVAGASLVRAEPGADGGDSSPSTAPMEIGPGGMLDTESDYRSAAETKNPRHLHFLYESRYVTEGRDNLDGNGLVSLSSDLSFGNFTFAPWLARGLGSDYTELNLNFAYGLQLSESIDLYASYTHLRFWPDESPKFDNELAAELVVDWPKVAETILIGYYSFDTEGTFIELAVRRSQQIGARLTLRAQAALGINAGYVDDGHEGLNNATAGLDLAFHPAPSTELTAYLALNKAIDADPSEYAADQDLKDLAWGGLGLIHHF